MGKRVWEGGISGGGRIRFTPHTSFFSSEPGVLIINEDYSLASRWVILPATRFPKIPIGWIYTEMGEIWIFNPKMEQAWMFDGNLKTGGARIPSRQYGQCKKKKSFKSKSPVGCLEMETAEKERVAKNMQSMGNEGPLTQGKFGNVKFSNPPFWYISSLPRRSEPQQDFSSDMKSDKSMAGGT